MNPENNMGDNNLEVESSPSDNVSRSGRVRKKNSLLAVYDSTDDVVEKRKRRGNKFIKNAKVQKNARYQKGLAGRNQHYYQNYSISYNRSNDLIDDNEVPDIAGEEIIDDDEDETDYANNFHANNVRLKSQAESTYMMEKTFVKQKKLPGQGARQKATRKDKGSPRVTAYMLWAKDQRANFTKRFPHMDFSSLSKKLSDLWATVPQNQKRMWKTKAAKIMRKTANGAENMKNSSLSFSKRNFASIPQRKGMKNTTPPQVVHVPKRPPGRPPKNLLYPLVPPGPSNTSLMLVNNSSGSQSRLHEKIAGTPKQIRTQSQKSNSQINSSATTSTLRTINLADNKADTTPLFNPNTYLFKVECETETLDVAAHFSLLGESMKKLGAQIQNSDQGENQSMGESLSCMLNSLLCTIGPLLCLTQQVPELNCIPGHQLKRILSNVDYIMPGL